MGAANSAMCGGTVLCGNVPCNVHRAECTCCAFVVEGADTCRHHIVFGALLGARAWISRMALHAWGERRATDHGDSISSTSSIRMPSTLRRRCAPRRLDGHDSCDRSRSRDIDFLKFPRVEHVLVCRTVVTPPHATHPRAQRRGAISMPFPLRCTIGLDWKIS